MSNIKVDLANQQLTVKVRRSLVGFKVDAINEKVYVDYQETKYTGTIGNPDYVEISNSQEFYESDYASWLASPSGQAIQSAIEANLAKDVPGS